MDHINANSFEQEEQVRKQNEAMRSILEARGKISESPKVNPSPTGNILAEAQAVIYGDREKTYGAPDKNLQVIADLWGAYRGTEYTVDDVCCMMVLLKLARLKNQPGHRDSQVDACGYMALMERVQEYRKNQNHVGKTNQNPSSSTKVQQS